MAHRLFVVLAFLSTCILVFVSLAVVFVPLRFAFGPLHAWPSFILTFAVIVVVVVVVVIHSVVVCFCEFVKFAFVYSR